MMSAKPGHLLVKVTEEDRRKIFEKPIRRSDGVEMKLLVDIKAESGFEKAYQQSVGVGTIISVGDNVKYFKEGDGVILDYAADLLENCIFESTAEHKILSVSTRTKYKTKDLIIAPTYRSPRSTVVHRKGDIYEISMLIAAIREGVIIVNPPYLLLSNADLPTEFTKTVGGVYDLEKPGMCVDRKIAVASPESIYKEGDNIICEWNAVFSRTYNEFTYEVMFEHDVIAVEKEEGNV